MFNVLFTQKINKTIYVLYIYLFRTKKLFCIKSSNQKIIKYQITSLIMARKEYYSQSEKENHLAYYENLTEKQRRHFLGKEYKYLGRGSQRYLAKTFKCSRQTIINGVKELEDPNYEADYTRQRSLGGGRKKKQSN